MEKVPNKAVTKSVSNVIVDYNQLLQDIPDEIKETKGEGVTIAVLDTGCIHHDDLNIVEFYDAVENKVRKRTEFIDDTGHGTFVTGLITSTGGKSGIVGIAPKSKIIIVKVSENGAFFSRNVLNGLKWLLENKKCNIINLSFNCEPGHNNVLINDTLRMLKLQNTIIVAAAGDDKRIFGNSNILYPAIEDNVVAVGAIQMNLTTGLSLNPSIDYVLPKLNNYESILKLGANFKPQGCSFATAVVSGTFSILIASGSSHPDIKKELDNTLTKFILQASVFNNVLKIYKK